MSAMNSDAGDGERPNLHLSRRSLVAAGALVAMLGTGAAKQARAQNAPPNGPIYGAFCKLEGNADIPQCLCFLSGTRLLTPLGEVSIEGLRVGDLVMTKGGEVSAIRWIGRIAVDRDGRTPWHADAMPVRVAKGALGADMPRRDLYLSRLHMVHLNGVLIPIGDLINGRTIVPVDVDGDQLVYYHIALESHDVVIAEGAPCESLLVTAEKLAMFDNADEYYALYGTSADMVPCAPLAAFNGGRSQLKSRLRSAISPVVDLRHPRDIARDRLEARAFDLSRAA